MLVKERYESGKLRVTALPQDNNADRVEKRRQHGVTAHLDLGQLRSQPLHKTTSSHTPFTTSMNAHFMSSGAFIT